MPTIGKILQSWRELNKHYDIFTVAIIEYVCTYLHSAISLPGVQQKFRMAKQKITDIFNFVV